MEVTEQDVDYVMAVLELRHGVEEYPNEWYETREQQREQLRLSAQCGNWPVREYRAVAAVALAARTREVEAMREALDATRKALVQCAVPYTALLVDTGSRAWIAPSVWREIVSAVSLAQSALAAQEGTR